MTLAEIPYPRIDPNLLPIGRITVRWYGVTYVLAFALAFLVLRGLAKRGRWPVAPDRVSDVLFWGILGVFVGGRLGWLFFYGLPGGTVKTIGDVFTVWKGGMSFHGGLLGVIVAYWIYTRVTKTPRGIFFDGLTLATPLGILCVRLANFVNAELYGRVWDGPWAMKFPKYGEFGGYDAWTRLKEAGDPRQLFTALRHPSQLYEGLGEGLLMFFFLRWLMLKRGVTGGRIAGIFLMAYGTFRFFIEYVREPDVELGTPFLGMFTRGQQLCLGMIAAGLIVLGMCAIRTRQAESR